MKRTVLIGVSLLFCAIGMSDAVTLETALQTTLDKNPAIQQAKLNLEQAAGQRLILRSVIWPSAQIDVPAGVQGGKRAGESTTGFIFARGSFVQPLFNAAIPASLRRGDVDVLIAQQQLNVAVVDQLHSARLAFYSALYDRSLQTLRTEQRQRLDQNVAGQKDRYEAGLADRNAITSATMQARGLDSQIEGARRDYADARLKLAQAMGLELESKNTLPDPEGALTFAPKDVDLDSETKAALERRADLKLARLLVRAANEDQRVIEAAYYPSVTGFLSGYYVPVTGIHREGSTRRTDDLISSEAREGASYTWSVIDNGKVTGAVRKQRAAREINEIALHKLESSVTRELLNIRNNLQTIQAKRTSFSSAMTAAEGSTRTVEQNLAGGLASAFEYRMTENGYLETRSGLLDATYAYVVAQAEWDRATGRYFQFTDIAEGRGN